ncbi:MAG: hypothetical protein QME81_20570, partial [bacterium]|nr:hypothetical protein [bacterium]
AGGDMSYRVRINFYNWSDSYGVNQSSGGAGTVTVTVYDRAGNDTSQTFYTYEDTAKPDPIDTIVVLIDTPNDFGQSLTISWIVPQDKGTGTNPPSGMGTYYIYADIHPIVPPTDLSTWTPDNVVQVIGDPGQTVSASVSTYRGGIPLTNEHLYYVAIIPADNVSNPNWTLDWATYDGIGNSTGPQRPWYDKWSWAP